MENINGKKTGFKLLEVIIIMIVTVSIGVAVGISAVFLGVSTNNLQNCNDINVNDPNIKEIIETYNSIINNYYVDVDKDEITTNAIRSMLETLGDPHSTYMNDEQTTSFDDRMQGDYQGIGAEIIQDKYGNIIILKAFDGSPAQTIGIMSQDIIISVDEKSVKGLTTTEVASLLKGRAGTTVDVKILRGEVEKNFTITRNKIVITSVKHQMFTENNKKIGYIKIDIFSNNTYDQFKAAVLELEKNKINSLIIDVRDNSGGYLNRVSEMTSMFLPKNKLIYQLEDRNGVQKIYSYTEESRSYPMVVLINKYSASASEIMAAALMESYGATVIGVNSFGKGTVQQTFKLETGGMIKYTTQKWLTPNGNWINEVGIEPNIKIEQIENYYSNPSAENDAQLKKAIEVLSK